MNTNMLQPAGERDGTKEVRHVITVVHGTWAKNASWIQPDSALSKELRERLGQDTKIFPFIWTGRNSPSARSDASERLKEELALRLEDHATARHCIICHSHGGNVALGAVAGTDLERKIDGIVCLATPFLVARARDFGSDQWTNIAAAILVGLWLLMFSVGAVLQASWPGLVTIGIQTLVMMAVGGPLLILAKKWRTFASELQRELTPPPIDPRRVLIVRSPADEASGALVFSQFISWITVRGYLWSQSLFARLETAATRWAKRKWKVLAVAAVAFVLMLGFIFLVAYSYQTDQSWLRTIAWTVLIVSFVIVVEALVLVFPFIGGVDFATMSVRLVVSSLIWPMIFLLSVFLLPFGWRIALANVLLDVTAETTPVGSGWTVHLLEPPASSERGKVTPSLMHSIIYENPSALTIVCDWIAERAAFGAAEAHDSKRIPAN